MMYFSHYLNLDVRVNCKQFEIITFGIYEFSEQHYIYDILYAIRNSGPPFQNYSGTFV